MLPYHDVETCFKLERADGTLEDHILSMRDEAEKEVEEALDLMRQKGRWMLERQVLTLIGKCKEGDF